MCWSKSEGFSDCLERPLFSSTLLSTFDYFAITGSYFLLARYPPLVLLHLVWVDGFFCFILAILWRRLLFALGKCTLNKMCLISAIFLVLLSVLHDGYYYLCFGGSWKFASFDRSLVFRVTYEIQGQFCKTVGSSLILKDRCWRSLHKYKFLDTGRCATAWRQRMNVA